MRPGDGNTGLGYTYAVGAAIAASARPGLGVDVKDADAAQYVLSRLALRSVLRS